MKTGFYIGGQRLDVTANTDFVWKHPVKSGKPHQQIIHRKWANGEPNNYENGNEACIQLLSGQNYKWNDISCLDAICFVCEIDND